MKTLLIRERIGKRVITLREERKMTSEQLAIKIGLSKSGLRYIERGMKDPRAETLLLTSQGLGVKIVDLFEPVE